MIDHYYRAFRGLSNDLSAIILCVFNFQYPLKTNWHKIQLINIELLYEYVLLDHIQLLLDKHFPIQFNEKCRVLFDREKFVGL